MGLDFPDLDDATRQHMLAELERDIRTDNLYLGKYLTAAGETEYPKLLREAIESGTDDHLQPR